MEPLGRIPTRRQTALHAMESRGRDDVRRMGKDEASHSLAVGDLADRPDRQASLSHVETTRSLPRRIFLPDWVWAFAFVSTIAGSIVTDTPWFFVGLAVLAIGQGMHVFHVVRCPVCRGRLAFHNAPTGHATRYRFQLACPRCLVRWDSGKISDDHTD